MVVPLSPKQIFITSFTLNIGQSIAKQVIRAVKKNQKTNKLPQRFCLGKKNKFKRHIHSTESQQGKIITISMKVIQQMKQLAKEKNKSLISVIFHH